MDQILRDTMFAGLSDHEIAETVCMEMRRRQLSGCVFFVPDEGNCVFGSSSPAGTLSDYSAAYQLEVFSKVAARAVREQITTLPDEDDTSFNFGLNKWVN